MGFRLPKLCHSFFGGPVVSQHQAQAGKAASLCSLKGGPCCTNSKHQAFARISFSAAFFEASLSTTGNSAATSWLALTFLSSQTAIGFPSCGALRERFTSGQPRPCPFCSSLPSPLPWPWPWPLGPGPGRVRLPVSQLHSTQSGTKAAAGLRLSAAAVPHHRFSCKRLLRARRKK